MSTHRKVYRFRLKPTADQAHALNRMAGARRWVWNWGLRRRREHYRDFGKTLSYQAMAAELTALKAKPETAWLKDADSQALQQALMDLCQAFVNFFEGRARFPRFKSKKRDKARFRIPQRVKLEGGMLSVPKVKDPIKVRQTREVSEPTRGATFRREANGTWYVSLVVEFEMPDVPLPPPDAAKVIGVDLGLKDFAVRSDGERTAAPKFYRKAQRRLKRAQRHASRCVKGSERHAKAKARVARIHRQITNRRKDFLHRLTADLVSEHQGVCIEDLNVKALARTKLSKSFTDAALGEFRRQVEYKSTWNRKHLVVIDRFFPSSRLCRGCGAINEALTLSDRQWVCGCGMVHDRDLSAAINIRDEGLRILNESPGRVTPDGLNARGDRVRPRTSGR